MKDAGEGHFVCRRSNTLRCFISNDCKRIALRRSPLFIKKAKDAEGVRPLRVNLSGKRTEAIGFKRPFLCTEFFMKLRLFFYLAG